MAKGSDLSRGHLKWNHAPFRGPFSGGQGSEAVTLAIWGDLFNVSALAPVLFAKDFGRWRMFPRPKTPVLGCLGTAAPLGLAAAPLAAPGTFQG